MKNVQHSFLFASRLLLLGVLVTACQKTPTLTEPNDNAGRDAVLAWNQASMAAITRMTNPTTGFFVLPHVEGRAYAIVNLAMYDALNSIEQKNAPYALQTSLVPGASPDAAV